MIKEWQLAFLPDAAGTPKQVDEFNKSNEYNVEIIF
jgi:hypothetical protein